MEALPNTSPSQRAQIDFFFKKPGPHCVLDATAILRYLSFSRPYWMSVTIMLGYLGAAHCATFVAMLLAARHERR
jgi:hypothetical protein